MLTQSCFVTPWTVAHQAPLFRDFAGKNTEVGLPFPPPGDLFDPGMEPTSLVPHALQVDSLPAEPLGKWSYLWVLLSLFCG